MIKGLVASAGIATALITGLIPADLSSKAADQDGAVTKLCLAGFNAAMSHAGKTPPSGMGRYTCSCFLEQVTDGASITEAQATCKSRAAERFNM